MGDNERETAPDGGDSIIGRTVLGGNYRVEKQIGEGAMGRVYLLRHSILPDTLAALKTLLAEGIADAAMVARFVQEAKAAAAIGSHRVVKPIDIGRFEDGVHYFVMEYVPGRSLKQELSVKGLPTVARALKIACRLADSMALAHERRIVHRDLKPENLMLTREGGKEDAVKILDFGVARVMGELKVARTMENARIGTPGYWSPEAAAGIEVDGRTDVFSLGIILFEMLTAELPFAAPTLQMALGNVLTQPTPRVSSLRPRHLEEVPEHVEELVSRALEKEPSQRFTMAELHAALSASISLIQGEAGAPTTAMSVMQSGNLPTDAQPTLSRATDRVSDLIVRSTPAPSAAAATRTHDEQRTSETRVRATDRVATSLRRRWPRWLGATLALLAIAAAGIGFYSTSEEPPPQDRVAATTDAGGDTQDKALPEEPFEVVAEPPVQPEPPGPPEPPREVSKGPGVGAKELTVQQLTLWVKTEPAGDVRVIVNGSRKCEKTPCSVIFRGTGSSSFRVTFEEPDGFLKPREFFFKDFRELKEHGEERLGTVAMQIN